MVSANILATLVLNVISSMVVLSMVAIGLGIIFGLMGVINTAHGAFFTIGAFSVWFIGFELGAGFWAGFVAAPIIGAAIGIAVESIVVKHLYNRLIDSLLAMWGVSLVITQLLILVFGSTTRSINGPLQGQTDLGVTTYPTYRLFLIGFGLLVLLSVFAAFYRTKFGVRLRAVIDDETNARLLGLDQERIYRFAFGFGTGLAALAGAAVTPFVSINATMGLPYLVDSFLTVIVGGTGTLLGVVPGSLIVGGMRNFFSFGLQPILAEALVYIIVIGIILIRPQGVLSR